MHCGASEGETSQVEGGEGVGKGVKVEGRHKASKRVLEAFSVNLVCVFDV